jgi:hypothetical protein
MKSIRLLAAVLPLVAAEAVHAGSTGAGPAGSATPAVGSIVVPGSHALLDTAARDDSRDRVLPGNGDQIASTAAALRGFNGATVQGDLLRAPTVLADGTPAVIALNTRTGRLSVTRQER